jgi:hypothetical protein
MFKHKKCNNDVYIDLSDHVKIYCTPGLGKESLRISLGAIDLINSGKAVESKFYCPTCKQSVDINDIVVRCKECGKYYDINEILRVVKDGEYTSHLVCKNHSDRLLSLLGSEYRVVSAKKFFEKMFLSPNLS